MTNNEKIQREIGKTGKLSTVYVDIEPDRDGKDRWVIIITVDGTDGNKYELRNNWDGSKENHDQEHGKRLRNAQSLIGKEIKTIVWNEYNPDNWFCDLEKLNNI